jgi:hypothetical protein
MLKKTWLITGEITQEDKEWILRSKLDFMQGEQHYMEFVDIVTTTDKEETWLKLYFADRLILADKYYYDERFYT